MSENNLGFVSSRESFEPKSLQTTNGTGKSNGNSTTKNDEMHSIEFKDRQKQNSVTENTYEPYDNRMVQHPTSTLDTLFHLLKGSLGTGILAMPQAFSHSGYAVGVIATILIGLFCTYSIHILIKSSYELCRRRKVPALSYPATAKSAVQEGPSFLHPYASLSAHIVNVFLLAYQLGTCIVYTVFISQNLKAVIDAILGFSKEETREIYYTLLILVPLIFINWIRNLKLLAPVSTGANVITLISFILIIYLMCLNEFTLNQRKIVGSFTDFPLFFGTVLFALEAIGVILPLENEMKKPKSFKSKFGVLNVGMFIITLMYVCMGFFGYIFYGEKVDDSITLNLPSNGDDGSVLAKVVQSLLAVSIFMTHSLQCYVAIDIIWNLYISKRVVESKQILGEYIVRTAVVIGTVSLAMMVPNIGFFISLVGSFCLSALALAFPAIIESCTFWSVQNKTQNKLMLIKNTVIVIIAFIGLVSGTYASFTLLNKEKKTK